MSFPNATSLTSHSKAHQRQERLEQLGATTLKQDIRNKKLIPQELLSSQQTPDANRASSPCSSSLNSSPSSPILGDSAPVDSNEANIRPSTPISPGGSSQERNLPHPDDPPPSHKFNLKFKEFLEADNLPPWEEFTTVFDFIAFSRKKMKIKDPPAATTVFKQQNVENPKFIQALYRRNRRRAVRKVIGGKHEDVF